jgi:hypothetical protein
MSVVVSDLVIYGSANMPDVDGATVGGAVAFSKRLAFSDISPNGLLDYVSSSSSDTAVVITVSGLDASGVATSENKTLTGQTPVNGAQTFERILKAVASGTTAVGDVAAISHTAVVTGTAQAGAAATSTLPSRLRLQSGQGASVALGQIVRITNNTPTGAQYQLRYIVGIGTNVDPAASSDDVYLNRDWGTVPSSSTTYTVNEGALFDLSPNQVTEIRRPFYGAVANAAGGATLTFYEKVFAVNNNATTSLVTATLSVFSESPSLGTGVHLDIAVCKALNDTQTATNRQTLPTNGDSSALTFTSGSPPQSQSVPSPGNLPSGSAPNSAGAEGIWLKLTLPAGSLPYKGVGVLRTQGASA